MKKSSTSVNEAVMGRADVLFRFLQLIGKDRPRDLDQYLKDLKEDIQERPIADRIVDLIIAGERQLYDRYLQARREVGARNPYASVENLELDSSRGKALGIFLVKWIDLEKIIRSLAEATPEPAARQLVFPTREILEKLTWIPEEIRREIERIRTLRNKAIHGIDSVDELQLMEASKSLDRVLSYIRENLPKE